MHDVKLIGAKAGCARGAVVDGVDFAARALRTLLSSALRARISSAYRHWRPAATCESSACADVAKPPQSSRPARTVDATLVIIVLYSLVMQTA